MTRTKPFEPKHHQTHRESLLRFLALLALLGLYFGYMSLKFDLATGALLALLSWSFFVLCTPVADGGFLVAFPVRLLFGGRMMFTQGVVWAVAILINIVALQVSPDTYQDSPLTRIFYMILTTPWPYWSILALSAVGTAISMWFGDEMLDVTSHQARQKHHRHGFKYRTLMIVSLGALTVAAYYQLLSGLNLQIPTG